MSVLPPFLGIACGLGIAGLIHDFPKSVTLKQSPSALPGPNPNQH
jgi:hypothetical protein